MVDYSDLAQPLNNQQSTNSQYADLAQPLQGGVSKNNLGNQIVSGIENIPGAVIGGLKNLGNSTIQNISNIAQNPSVALGIPAALAHGAGQGVIDLATGLYNVPGTLQNMMGGNVQATKAPQLQFGSTEAQQNPLANIIGGAAPYAVAAMTGNEVPVVARLGLMGALGTPTTDIGQRITAGGAGAIAGATEPILKRMGANFEATQPNVAQFLAKIPKEDYQTILDAYKSGQDPFAGKAQSLNDLQIQAKTFTQNQADALQAQKDALVGNPNLNNAFVKSQLNDFNNNAQSDIENLKNNSKQSIQNLQTQHDAEKVNAIQQATNLAHQTSDTINRVQDIYGKQIGQQVAALKDTDNIPLSDINNLIDSNIKGAGQGTEINPAGDEASLLGSQLKSMFTRGALKNQGLNDSQINAYLNKTQDIPNISEDSIRQASINSGMSAFEANEYIAQMKQAGMLGNNNSVSDSNIPQINPDDLDISQKALHVAKQYLQSRKINYDAESNPVSGIVKNIASDFNNTLRDINPDYADVNDQYSELAQFLNKPENAFFNNPDQMASKFANIGNNSAITSDTLNKVRQLENLMQESGLNPNISSNLENIRNLPVQHAQQIQNLKNNIDAQKQQLLQNQTINQQTLQQNLVKQMQGFEQGQANDLQSFMESQQIPLARTSFEKAVPTSSGMANAGNLLMGGYDIASLIHGNLIPVATHAGYNIVRSPLVQKALLEAYMKGQNMAPKITPYTTPLSASAIQQQINKGGQ